MEGLELLSLYVSLSEWLGLRKGAPLPGKGNSTSKFLLSVGIDQIGVEN